VRELLRFQRLLVRRFAETPASLDIKLERDGRRVLLTPAAYDLVERARRILDDLDAAETALRASTTTVEGVVRIGAFPSAAVRLVVPARALAICHPGCPGRASTKPTPTTASRCSAPAGSTCSSPTTTIC
jgi:hypothetical protein